MQHKEWFTLNEMGYVFRFNKRLQTKFGNQWNTSCKLSAARMFSVLALSQLVDEYTEIGMSALKCLDAIPGVGLAGLMWKALLNEKVEVVVNTMDNAKTNQATETTETHKFFQAKSNITYVQQEPNSLLHSSQVVNFIYLEAYGNCVEYLEAACHVISHKGIICIVSTDLSTLYNKSPDRVRRLYHGHTMKNEYMKETAVRLILANLARAASRWGRGFSVLSSYVDGDSIVIVARIFRGANHADKSLDLVKKIAHCRECQFRCVQDEKLHLTEKSNINCFCIDGGMIDDEILPPIMFLGPVYTGPIFDVNFLYKIMKKLKILSPQHLGLITIQSMIIESFCCEDKDEENELLKILAEDHTRNSDPSQDSKEPEAKKPKTTTFESLCTKYNSMEFPVLYTIPQTHTKKGCNPPKVIDVIQKLRSNGFRAGKTTFDPRGLRTSAPLKDLCRLIDDISKETCVS